MEGQECRKQRKTQQDKLGKLSYFPQAPLPKARGALHLGRIFLRLLSPQNATTLANRPDLSTI